MRENIFQQIVACTQGKDGQIHLIFNENKDEFYKFFFISFTPYGANRLFCYDVRVSRAWLSIELWNQPVCDGDLSSESPLLQCRHLRSFFYGKYMNIYKLREKKGRGKNYLWFRVLTSLTIN